MRRMGLGAKLLFHCRRADGLLVGSGLLRWVAFRFLGAVKAVGGRALSGEIWNWEEVVQFSRRIGNHRLRGTADRVL